MFRNARLAQIALLLAGLTAALLVAVPLLSRMGFLTLGNPVGVNGFSPAQKRQWLADPRFFIPHKDKGIDGWISHHPNMVQQIFPAMKPDKEFRIFLLGGSAALGIPYVHSQPEIAGVDLGEIDLTNTGGIATWLEYYFALSYPDRTVRVINAAVGSQDLRTAAAIFAEVAQIGDPDLVLVMSGNNENYNVVYRTAEEFDAALKRLTANYEEQIRTIATLAEQYEILTYPLTVPTNLREWIPNSHGTTLNDEKLGHLINLASETPEAPEIDLGLKRIDAANQAMHRYIGGLRKIARGNLEGGYRDVLAAKDLDFNLVRTHSQWNDAALAAQGRFVHPFDLATALREFAVDRAPGFDLFHDNCHLTINANVLAARAIVAFHRRERGLEAMDLPALDVRGYLKRNLQALYTIKAAKWKRIDELGQFEHLGEENRRRVAERFESENGDLETINQVIDLYELDLGESP